MRHVSRMFARLLQTIAEMRVNAVCERLVRKGVLVRAGVHDDGSRRYELTDAGRATIEAAQ